MGCGLIFCQQNSKLASCSFCALPFDKEVYRTDSNISSLKNDPRASLRSALNLQNRLLEADANSTGSNNVKEEFSEFVQTNFCPNSEINARKTEIEDFKAKLAKEKEERSSFDLSQMLHLQ